MASRWEPSSPVPDSGALETCGRDVQETLVERGDQSGATAVEYAIVASLIALVIAATVALIGEAVTGVFDNLMSLMGW